MFDISLAIWNKKYRPQSTPLRHLRWQMRKLVCESSVDVGAIKLFIRFQAHIYDSSTVCSLVGLQKNWKG